MMFCRDLFNTNKEYFLWIGFVYMLLLPVFWQGKVKLGSDPLPVPNCIIGLSATLDSIGRGGGETVLKAEDFMMSKIRHPKGQGKKFEDGQREITVYSLNRVGEDANKNANTLRFTCADVGQEVKVELHAWDADGNHGFCVCYAEIVDYKKLCTKD